MSALEKWKLAKQRVACATRIVAEAEATLADARREEAKALAAVWIDNARKILTESE